MHPSRAVPFVVVIGGSLSAACQETSKDTDTTDTTDGTDSTGNAGWYSDSPTGSTGIVGNAGWYFDGLNPTEIHLSSQFAYDSAARVVRDADFSGYAVPPDISIILATSAWDGSLASTSQYCAIVLPLTNATSGSWVAADPRLWYGVDYNLADVAQTNCNTPGLELDPNVWGADPIYGWLSDYYGGYNAWGIAVGEMSPDVQTVLATYIDPADLAFYLGGRMLIPEWLPGGPELDDIYGRAYQVDGNFSVVDDGSGYLVPIASDSVYAGNDILSAWYSLDSLVYWNIAP